MSHTYLLKLFQVARVNTESFTVQADDEEQAKAMADQLAKDKGLTKDFDFEIEDLTAKVQGDQGKQPEAPSELEAH